MARFLVRRILLGILVLFLTVTLVFALFYVYPSDVARTLAGRQATPDTIALIKARLGLDQPIYVQYGRYILEPAARQPGLRLLPQRPGHPDHRGGPAQDRLDRARRLGDLADPRRRSTASSRPSGRVPWPTAR